MAHRTRAESSGLDSSGTVRVVIKLLRHSAWPRNNGVLLRRPVVVSTHIPSVLQPSADNSLAFRSSKHCTGPASICRPEIFLVCESCFHIEQRVVLGTPDIVSLDHHVDILYLAPASFNSTCSSLTTLQGLSTRHWRNLRSLIAATTYNHHYSILRLEAQLQGECRPYLSTIVRLGIAAHTWSD